MRKTPHTNAATAALLALDDSRVALAVLDALTVAGANADWDAETIELVLEPLAALAALAGLPHPGGDFEVDSTAFYRPIADERDIEHDGETVDESDDTVGADDSDDDRRGGVL
jgi:hypothetical protein